MADAVPVFDAPMAFHTLLATISLGVRRRRCQAYLLMVEIYEFGSCLTLNRFLSVDMLKKSMGYFIVENVGKYCDVSITPFL